MNLYRLLYVEWVKSKRLFSLLMLIVSLIYVSVSCFISLSIGQVENNHVADTDFFYIFLSEFIKDITLLIPIWVITVVGTEFDYKIIQKNLADGWTRYEYLLSKAIYILMLIGYFSCIYFALFSLFKRHFGLWDELDGSVISWGLAHIFITIVGFSVFSFLVILIVRRLVVALAVYFGIVFFEQALAMVAVTQFDTELPQVLPLSAVRSLSFSADHGFRLMANTPTTQYFIFTAYLVTAILLILRCFIKSDLPPL